MRLGSHLRKMYDYGLLLVCLSLNGLELALKRPDFARKGLQSVVRPRRWEREVQIRRCRGNLQYLVQQLQHYI